MIKITFIGAGSTVFVRNVIGDSMRTPALRDAEIALYDIDAERLKDSEIILSALNRNINDNRAHISCYPGEENRKAALKDVTFVINAIQVGGYDPCTITDFEIPKKYGLRQTIADTLGIGGIMRALRTIPVMEAFAHEMEEVCPNAWLLSIADKDGVDLYPEIKKRAAAKNAAGGHKDMVRFDYIKNFGYYCIESSEHNAEYNLFYIKSKYPELIEKFNIPLDEYPRRCINQIKGWEEEKKNILADGKITHDRTHEYASYIMEAMITNLPYKIGGNVLNNGLISNIATRI